MRAGKRGGDCYPALTNVYGRVRVREAGMEVSSVIGSLRELREKIKEKNAHLRSAMQGLSSIMTARQTALFILWVHKAASRARDPKAQ